MSCSCVDADRCGCCEGTRAITPRDTFNRPGLSVLHRRIGDHHDFLETMLSGIARTWIDVETGGADPHGRPRRERTFPLRDLRTRAPDDPTIALLDLWAIVGDILSFYSERTATEGYLRTATELMSVSELARLVGYERRPGVSASAFLAFTVDDARTGPLVVPAGARVQSLPGPGETPVFFETDVPLSANAAWNELLPRRHRPTYLPRAVARSIPVIYFAGTATRLEPNMPLLLSYGNDDDDQELRFVSAVQEDYDNDRTRARLRPVKASEVRHLLELPQVFEPVDLEGLVRQLERPPSRLPSAPARLAPSLRGTFGPGSSTVDRLFADFHPTAEGTLASARARARVTANPELRAIYALRVRASVYGHTSLPPANVDGVREAGGPDWPYEPDVPHSERRRVIDLDTTYDAIVPGSWVVIVRRAIGKEQGEDSPVQRVFVITRVARVETVSRIDYDTPAKVTRLELESSWLPADKRLSLRDIRPTVVFAVPEELALAEEPIIAPVCGGTIELDRLVDGLEPGRWLIVTGERAASVEVENAAGDAFSATGVPVSEVTMLADVRQDVLHVLDGEVVSPQAAAGKGRALPGDHVHTFLELAAPLAYCYVRDTMKIYGNVAQATHGETHAEPLGSGDPAQILQSFDLKNNPLTHIPAATPSGERSTLEVYVDGVRWHEAEDPFALGSRDRAYVTSRDHTEKTSVIFGDGETGARLPKGVENVRAVYRSGIGKPGNVRAGQLSLLVTRTDGLRGVTNPQRASGGADPDGVESTRARAPLAVGALDRLVSTSDYADFALTFAGIAKARAARLPARGGSFVHVTVAGEDDVPIDLQSELAVELLEALRRFGDPFLPVQLAVRELLALVIAARVRPQADYPWETLRPKLEAALGDRFGFGHRDLAQDAYAAEALAAMQGTPGVDYVDLEVFAAISESATAEELASLGSALSATGAVHQRIAAHPARVTGQGTAPAPAQLAVLLTDVPTTVLLTEIPQ
jgi:predicted phage baseplate assembly protein